MGGEGEEGKRKRGEGKRNEGGKPVSPLSSRVFQELVRHVSPFFQLVVGAAKRTVYSKGPVSWRVPYTLDGFAEVNLAERPQGGTLNLTTDKSERASECSIKALKCKIIERKTSQFSSC